MLFNSFAFLCFFVVVFHCYWLVFARAVWIRNLFLIAASYFFYGWWDYRFLGLVVLSSAIDYGVGVCLARASAASLRKSLLGVSVVFNLGSLGFFKYHNFFLGNLELLLQEFGITLDTPTLRVILPLGISFYTLQTLGYTIDVYYGRIPPTRNVMAFFAYVCFFPQLIAGPIERASHLLPQFESLRPFDYRVACDGLRQILWGLFKKVVIADQCASLADPVFASFHDQSASTIAVAAFYFSLQIYCDFSGYSDIAIGLAKLLRFDLMKNFDTPYFSTSVAGFWRRWHVSLSTWFRDYLYIPLGGSRGTRGQTIRNLFVVFTVSGLWHGPMWNYVLWGWLHFAFLVPGILRRPPSERGATSVTSERSESLKTQLLKTLKAFMVFVLVTYAWILFRVPGGWDALQCLVAVWDLSLFSKPDCSRIGFLWAGVLFVSEWYQRDRDHALQVEMLPVVVRWPLYVILIVLCFGYFREESPFIYFQF